MLPVSLEEKQRTLKVYNGLVLKIAGNFVLFSESNTKKLTFNWKEGFFIYVEDCKPFSKLTMKEKLKRINQTKISAVNYEKKNHSEK